MKLKAGMRFRVMLDEVKDVTGYPVMRGVGFLWNSRSGASFTKGDEFTILDVTGQVLWVTSSSHCVDGKEVAVYTTTLKEALKAGMVQVITA